MRYFFIVADELHSANDESCSYEIIASACLLLAAKTTDCGPLSLLDLRIYHEMRRQDESEDFTRYGWLWDDRDAAAWSLTSMEARVLSVLGPEGLLDFNCPFSALAMLINERPALETVSVALCVTLLDLVTLPVSRSTPAPAMVHFSLTFVEGGEIFTDGQAEAIGWAMERTEEMAGERLTACENAMMAAVGEARA